MSAETPDWSAGHGRLRVELFLSSLLLGLISHGYAKWSDSTILPFKIEGLPAEWTILGLALFTFYCLVHFILKTLRESQTVGERSAAVGRAVEHAQSMLEKRHLYNDTLSKEAHEINDKLSKLSALLDRLAAENNAIIRSIESNAQEYLIERRKTLAIEQENFQEVARKFSELANERDFLLADTDLSGVKQSLNSAITSIQRRASARRPDTHVLSAALPIIVSLALILWSAPRIVDAAVNASGPFHYEVNQAPPSGAYN
ncbi:hypothetical protein [Sinorhizobium meliloti]|uniref:hypothetical protein n=1 Tax=Rhizobium meliloti TaxID=382 RepID=UPI000FDA0D65|nr:hypothetical protein [Sinorhizobium meliloti]RVG76124.1 hypothetical protein CN220_00610 [Sinorhizobium meliloti]RVG76181.1 hypothetical protein CN220_01055 [Sinorhizobium meliloti]